MKNTRSEKMIQLLNELISTYVLAYDKFWDDRKEIYLNENQELNLHDKDVISIDAHAIACLLCKVALLSSAKSGDNYSTTDIVNHICKLALKEMEGFIEYMQDKDKIN